MVVPYLSFDGDCEAAFELYRRAFDAPPAQLARYGDAPHDPARPVAPEHRRKIRHGRLRVTASGSISGADAVWPVPKGSAVSIHAHCPTLAAAERAYAVLAEDGHAFGGLAPGPTPHDDGVSGTVLDRYGFTWIVSADIG